jgi:hypothetical protein
MAGFCGNCGTPLQDEGGFCGQCGTKAVPPQAEVFTEPAAPSIDVPGSSAAPPDPAPAAATAPFTAPPVSPPAPPALSASESASNPDAPDSPDGLLATPPLQDFQQVVAPTGKSTVAARTSNSRMVLFVIAAVVIAVLIVAVVRNHKSNAAYDNHESALDAIGFNNPLAITVQLDQVPPIPNGQYNDDNASLAALLIRANYASTQPSPDSAPWWHFNVSGGTLNGNAFTFDAGSRVISSRSDEQSWTEGSVQYFAETITYSIDLNGQLKKVVKAPLDGLTLRFVAMKDPAIGTWQISNDPTRGTKFSQDDVTLLSNRLAAVGSDALGVLTVEIYRARNEAFQEIQNRLASDGTLERNATDPHVLVSKKNQIMFYKGDTINNPQSTTIGALKSYCSALQAAGKSWHLATSQDIQEMIAPVTPSSTVINVIDTPDHRLWEDFSTPESPGFQIITDSAQMYFSYTQTSHDFKAVSYQLQFQGSQFIPSVEQTTYDIIAADADTAPLRGLPIKVVCVANFN